MKPNGASKCGVCQTPSLERNNYYYGKQFTVRDLLQEQSYFEEKRRLINRAVLGWGVVCGLGVEWSESRREFTVHEGMALDCCGHEIIVCEERQVPFEKYEEACRSALEGPGAAECKYVLCLEYDECKTEPVDLPPLGCDRQGRTEYNRVRAGFDLKIKKWEDACPKQPYGGIACLDRFKHPSGDVDTDISCSTETLHQHLCSQISEGCGECECCDCVVLATIYVRPVRHEQYEQAMGQSPAPAAQEQRPQPHEQQEQGRPGVGARPRVEVTFDQCADRRFVYNNSLLYDLINCHHGDLPHVVDFNWRKYAYSQGEAGGEPTGRQMDWESFVRLIKGGLTVYFDQEMAAESLNPHTFFLTFFDRQEETGTFVVKRIPAKRILYPTEQKGPCYEATFFADEGWVEDELTSKNSELAVGVDIEITLRGSRIWSKKGKALDGDFLADKLPTGNGTQGGDFVDWFHVVRRDTDKPKAKTYGGF